MLTQSLQAVTAVNTLCTHVELIFFFFSQCTQLQGARALQPLKTRRERQNHSHALVNLHPYILNA